MHAWGGLYSFLGSPYESRARLYQLSFGQVPASVAQNPCLGAQRCGLSVSQQVGVQGLSCLTSRWIVA